VPREELFVTTKLPNSDHGYDSAMRAFDASIGKLGLDYLDLYLIHWPLPGIDIDFVETWQALEEIYRSGRAKAIGVSNFLPEHLTTLLEATSVVPAVSQIELHPQLQQQTAREVHAEHGIATEARSPLGSGKGLLDVPAIVAIARKHGRTPAQVVLRWHLQRGDIVFPKSMHRARMEENFAIFDVELTDDDLTAIAGLNRDERTGPDPTTFEGR
jgi:diketogulonate reductase-like aldo/keto reductase